MQDADDEYVMSIDLVEYAIAMVGLDDDADARLVSRFAKRWHLLQSFDRVSDAYGHFVGS